MSCFSSAKNVKIATVVILVPASRLVMIYTLFSTGLINSDNLDPDLKLSSYTLHTVHLAIKGRDSVDN